MKHTNLLKRDSLFALATGLSLAGVGFRVIRAGHAQAPRHPQVATALFGDYEYDGSLSKSAAPDVQASYSRSLLSLLASIRDVTYHLQNAHWTVKSTSFAEHHKFFNDAYNLFWEMQDTVAEHIRSYDLRIKIPNNPDGLRAFSLIDISDIEAAVPNETGIESRFQIHVSYYHVFLEKLSSMIRGIVKMARNGEIDDIAGDALFSELLGVVKKQMWMTRSYENENEIAHTSDMQKRLDATKQITNAIKFKPNPKFTGRVDFQAEKRKRELIEEMKDKAMISKK